MRSDRPDPRPRTRGPGVTARATATRLAAGALVLGLCAGVTACGDLRREGGQPVTPSAGPVEQVRQSAAERATALASAAAALEDAVRTGGAAAVGAPAADPAALGTALAGVREAARAHLAGLGGVWVPFPEASPSAAPESASPGPSPSASAGAPTVPSLVAELTAAAAEAQEAVGTVADGDLARLLASIGLGEELWAARLTVLVGAPAPAAPTADAPDALPAGLAADALAPLVASEDALGAAWELDAARSSDGARDASAALAAAHRATAQAWARAAGLDGTPTDPRRAAYDLPAVLTDPASAPEARTAVLAGLEDRLAGAWLDLVPQAEPGARDALVAAARVAVTRAIGLAGAAIPVLPAIDPAVTAAG